MEKMIYSCIILNLEKNHCQLGASGFESDCISVIARHICHSHEGDLLDLHYRYRHGSQFGLLNGSLHFIPAYIPAINKINCKVTN